MSGAHHVVVYNPRTEVVDRILQKDASVVSEWKVNGVDEILFELKGGLFCHRDLENWLRQKTHKEYTDMVVGTSKDEEVSDWIQTAKTLEDKIELVDLIPTEKEVVDSLDGEYEGGDIRKYLYSNYGGCEFTIRVNLQATRHCTITGFEPLSMNTLKSLVNIGMVSDQKPELVSGHPHYPSARRILRWASIVDEAWDVNCGAIGNLHFSPNRDEDAGAGFDGFVIYDADGQIKSWCDDRWYDVDSWSDREELEFPYMYPSEYDLRTSDSEYVLEDTIRMWWD